MIRATFIIAGVGSASAVGITIQGAAIEAMKMALYQLDELMADQRRDILSMVMSAGQKVATPSRERPMVVTKGPIALRLEAMEKQEFRAQYEVQANVWSIYEGSLALV